MPPPRIKRRLSAGRLAVAAFLLLGAALLALGIVLRPRFALNSRDAGAAFEPLASVPLRRLKGRGSISLKATIPSGPAWARLTRAWGDPAYVVAVAFPPPSNVLYCHTGGALVIDASANSRALPLEAAELPPYGYSSDCAPVGVRFQAPSGTTVTIRVSERPSPPPDRGPDIEPALWSGTLVVVPYWSGLVKDRLVGLALDDELRPISAGLILAGEVVLALAACAALALWWLSRRSRPKPQPGRI